ncbi:MAG: EamA family transporter [Candidatus Aminicenantes bacterium]|nr:MAG: EamA family transporter [Candidatus Aminicenantes bacterium]
MPTLNTKSVKLAIAFAAIYFIWGSTFLAIRFSITTIPPFFMMGFRCLVAGGILYAWARLRGVDRPQPAQWLTAVILGILLFTIGHGTLAWSEQFLPSGIAALICATSPIWIILLQAFFHRDNPLTPRVVFGLIMGLCGVALLIEPSMLLDGPSLNLTGAMVLLAGTLSWSIGAVYSKKANLPKNSMLAAGMNLITGGGGLLFASLYKETVILTSISLQSLVSLAYLIVFGSIFTFTAYFWLLRSTSPSRVATHSFVNPVVAIFVGWFAGGELINPRILIAALMMVIGVGAIVRNQNHKYKFYRAKEPDIRRSHDRQDMVWENKRLCKR